MPSLSSSLKRRKVKRYQNIIPLLLFIVVLCLNITCSQVYWYRIKWTPSINQQQVTTSGSGEVDIYFYFKYYSYDNATATYRYDYQNDHQTRSTFALISAFMVLSSVCTVFIVLIHLVVVFGFKKPSSLVSRSARVIGIFSLVSIAVSSIYFTTIVQSLYDDCDSSHQSTNSSSTVSSSSSSPTINNEIYCQYLIGNKFIVKESSTEYAPYTGWILSTLSMALNLIGLISIFIVTFKLNRPKVMNDEYYLLYSTPLTY